MMRSLSLSAVIAAQAQEPSPDKSLFIAPFYILDQSQENAEARFRDGYCSARHTADTESFTTIFNTGVGDNQVYFTREEFISGEMFNLHLINVSTAFAHAQGVSSCTGFAADGTEEDLDAIAENVAKHEMVTFVKDDRSFKRRQFKQEHYFALDYFMTLKPSDLEFFEQSWGAVRDLAATVPGILAYAMGVIRDTSGHPFGDNVTVHLQETFLNAGVYKTWLPMAGPYVNALLSVASFTDGPFLNPVAFFGTSDQLAQVTEECAQFGCVPYTFDDCKDSDDLVV